MYCDWLMFDKKCCSTYCMHQLGFVELYFYDQFIMCLDPIVVQFCLYNKNFLIIE